MNGILIIAAIVVAVYFPLIFCRLPSIAPGGSLTATVFMGLLTPDKASCMEQKINALTQPGQDR